MERIKFTARALEATVSGQAFGTFSELKSFIENTTIPQVVSNLGAISEGEEYIIRNLRLVSASKPVIIIASEEAIDYFKGYDPRFESFTI